MTVLSTSISPGDYHDSQCVSPCLVSTTVQYQIPPIKHFSIIQLQQIITDICRLPDNIHSNSILGLRISNVSFNEYENIDILKNHMDILWENCKLKRLDLDFTQCHLLDIIILERIIGILAHIQKRHNYNIYISLSLPINKNLIIDDQYLNIISRFKLELINICMINILIPKEFKRKNISWPEIVKKVFQNITHELLKIDNDRSMFVGKLNKYLGLIFDCDISSNFGSTLTNVVRKSVIHGERKNMSQMDFLNIWDWCKSNELGHLQLKWYLSNSKNLNQFLNQYKNIINSNNDNNNNRNLPLPQELIEITSTEIIINSQLPNYEIEQQQNNLELTRLPSYRTVCS